jgi:hypothetical protein
MANSIRFVANKAGIGELLKSAELQAVLMGKAQAVAAAAGPGHDVLNTTTKRARATVMTKTVEAMIAEATDHTLTRAINAARG